VGVPTELIGDVLFLGSIMRGPARGLPVAILYNFFLDKFIQAHRRVGK